MRRLANAVVLVAACLCGCGLPGDIVAMVGDQPITLSDLQVTRTGTLMQSVKLSGSGGAKRRQQAGNFGDHLFFVVYAAEHVADGRRISA